MYNPSPFVLSDAQPKSETLKPNLSKKIYGFCLWKLHQALASLNDASRTPRVLIFLHHPTWRLLCPILRPWITHQTILFSWCRLSPLVPGSFVSLAPPEGIFSITDQRMTSLCSQTVEISEEVLFHNVFLHCDDSFALGFGQKWQSSFSLSPSTGWGLNLAMAGNCLL